MICWWYCISWFRVDFRFNRFQDSSCCLLFFILLVIFLLESVTFTCCFTSFLYLCRCYCSLMFNLLLFITQWFFSAFDISSVLLMLVHPFSVSSRFVLYHHVVTVHYFLILVTWHCLCFFSSGWSWGLFTCSGGSDMFSDSGLVRWSSVPATLIAVPVLEWWQVPLVPLAGLITPWHWPSPGSVHLGRGIVQSLFGFVLFVPSYMFI